MGIKIQKKGNGNVNYLIGGLFKSNSLLPLYHITLGMGWQGRLIHQYLMFLSIIYHHLFEVLSLGKSEFQATL